MLLSGAFGRRFRSVHPGSLFRRAPQAGGANETAMRVKTVYLNDVPIGQASTWSEVRTLLNATGLRFIVKPGTAEGPIGFYVQRAPLKPLPRRSRTDESAA